MVTSKSAQGKYTGVGRSENNFSDQPAVEAENGNKAGSNRSDGSLDLLLIDPDVLNCDRCSKSLLGLNLILQSVDGAVICFSCYLKPINRKNKYIQSHLMGKVLRAVRMPCQNFAYGCKEIFPYSEKHEHEKMCDYSPCSCPLATCKFVGSSADLATHCRTHNWTHLVYDEGTYVHMYVSEEYKFYQEPKEGIIFIAHNKSQPYGNAFHISCIGPRYLKEGFAYDLIANHESSKGSCLRLQTTTDVVQELPMDDPDDLIKSLIVPNQWRSPNSSMIKLQFWIWKTCKQPDLIAIMKE